MARANIPRKLPLALAGLLQVRLDEGCPLELVHLALGQVAQGALNDMYWDVHLRTYKIQKKPLCYLLFFDGCLAG